MALRDLIMDILGKEVLVYAYPFGLYTDVTEALLYEMGARVTLTTHQGVSTLRRHGPDSLFGLHRFGVGEYTDPAELVALLEQELAIGR